MKISVIMQYGKKTKKNCLVREASCQHAMFYQTAADIQLWPSSLGQHSLNSTNNFEHFLIAVYQYTVTTECERFYQFSLPGLKENLVMFFPCHSACQCIVETVHQWKVAHAHFECCVFFSPSHLVFLFAKSSFCHQQCGVGSIKTYCILPAQHTAWGRQFSKHTFLIKWNFVSNL